MRDGGRSFVNLFSLKGRHIHLNRRWSSLGASGARGLTRTMRLQWLLLAALQPSCTFFLGQLSTLNQKSSNLLTSINLRLFRKPQPITTVVLDADGTTLNPDHEMTESVAAAINEARSMVLW